MPKWFFNLKECAVEIGTWIPLILFFICFIVSVCIQQDEPVPLDYIPQTDMHDREI